MKRKVYPAAALAALSLTAIGGVYADNAAVNDALSIGGAKIGIVQAITAAEAQVGGKASRAEYERHQGQWVFDVEVVNGNKVMDVRVDPTSGQVLAAIEDQADHEDDEGQGEDRAD
ncbi:PepSY domain-containing protein [uncultured Thiodictyon sp.]|uniref:PepSY domain-containing protein n=1 Tax=uncultured Thiodictyon sp. TaxID=1846217 RepID=UPI0025E9263F|nr:PepSY domain-containing protein [uncultured Thiodictyon sp.]